MVSRRQMLHRDAQMTLGGRGLERSAAYAGNGLNAALLQCEHSCPSPSVPAMRRFLAAVALLLCHAGFAVAQPAGKPPDKPMAMPVKLAAVKQGAVNKEATAVGTLLANESVMIRPEIAGRVTALHFHEGQKVA